MKLSEIIAEIKSIVANDCRTIYREGRCLSVKNDLGSWLTGEYISLLAYVDRKLMDRERYMSLMDRWGSRNYEDMDYAIYGDGDNRRQRWLRRWLLRELGLPEYDGDKRVVSSDSLWMEAANV